MNCLRFIILLMSCSWFANTAYAANTVEIIYDKPSNSKQLLVKQRLQNSLVIDLVASFIIDNFRFKQTLTITFGGDEGPLYDGVNNQISVPYAFIDEIEHRFKQANYQQTGVTIEDAVDDVLMHTILHELGHAVILMFDLPVLGKEEDAVDSLATLLLIEFFADGQEIAISAADLFDLESEDNTMIEDDFWSEHSLDIQRYYNIVCQVYGSNPEQYASIIESLAISQDRAQLCIEDYENLLASWRVLLRSSFRGQW